MKCQGDEILVEKIKEALCEKASFLQAESSLQRAVKNLVFTRSLSGVKTSY